MALPQVVLAIVSASLMHVLVPLFAGESEERTKDDAWAFIFLIGGMFGALVLVLFLSCRLWVPLLFSGFDEDVQILTVDLTRIQLIGMVFGAIGGVQCAYYHAKQEFIWVEFSPVLLGVISLFFLVMLLPLHGVEAAAWISTIRLGLQNLLLARGLGMPRRPNLSNEPTKEAWRRVRPLLLATIYYKTDPLVDRVLLSMASSGSLSLYYIAQQIYSAAGLVLNKAIATPLVPLLSISNKKNSKANFRQLYYRAVIKTVLICSVGLSFFWIFGHEVLGFLIGYRNFSSDQIDMLWWVMAWLAGMFFGSAVGQITSSSFYAIGDTRTPAKISSYTYTLYLPAKLIGFSFYGLPGLAIASSSLFLINLSILTVLLKKQYLDT